MTFATEILLDEIMGMKTGETIDHNGILITKVNWNLYRVDSILIGEPKYITSSEAVAKFVLESEEEEE